MIIGTAKEPIIEGDEIHWYYTGCEHTHGEVDMEKARQEAGARHLATGPLRRAHRGE